MVYSIVLIVFVAAVMYQTYLYYRDERNDCYVEGSGIHEEEEAPVQIPEQQESNIQNERKTDMEVTMGTRDLVFQTLRRIGCEYREEEENRILFKYQGEPFMIIANDNSFFIDVYDNWWYSLSTYCEVDEFARLQKVINHVNAFVNSTVLYTIHQESEQIGVHTKRNILFIPQIPEIESYLVSVLDDFFKTQRLVVTEIERIKVKEEKL